MNRAGLRSSAGNLDEIESDSVTAAPGASALHPVCCSLTELREIVFALGERSTGVVES